MILCTDFLIFLARHAFSIPLSDYNTTISMKHEIKGLKINDGQMMLYRLPFSWALA